jgi:hypothetical protein
VFFNFTLQGFIMTQSINSFAATINTLKAHRLAATSQDMLAVLGLKGSASVFAYTEAVHTVVTAWGLDTSQIFASDRNPKVIKRFIQFVHGISAKNYKSIDTTTSVIIYALHLTGSSPLTTDALHYLGAGLASGKVSPETRGISKRTLSKLFGSVGLSTIPTQTSRTVGKNGFLQLAGATVGEPGKPNQQVTLNADHPMIKAFFETMNSATDKQIDAMTEKKGA